jgi:hypothetical protein
MIECVSSQGNVPTMIPVLHPIITEVEPVCSVRAFSGKMAQGTALLQVHIPVKRETEGYLSPHSQ